MELRIDISPYKLTKRTEYSKLQVLDENKNIITNTSIGSGILSDYEQQSKYKKGYFNIENTILNDYMERSNLAYIFVPDDITHIKQYAFANSSIYYIHLPNNLQYMGSEIFKNCFNLEQISLPDSLRRIETKSFANCTNLKKINLSSSLLKIGNYSFSNCRALKDIVIPDTVSMIGSYAFHQCKSLEKINIPKDFESFGKFIFIESWVNTIEINHDILYHPKECYTDSLKYSKIRKIVVDNNVNYIDFQLFSDIKEQIQEIEYKGTKSEFETFASRNHVLLNDLTNATINITNKKIEHSIEHDFKEYSIADRDDQER